MKQITLKNGIRLVYEKKNNELTSFSIAFDAGASAENKDEIGLAHVVEHMIFKGTNKRDEKTINELCDEYFGFNNAMTNYPYVVYYGTCLSCDFEDAFELYSDILKNPIFPNEGFNEEIDVINQELKEWKDDLAQYCEDELFYNSFQNRRIKDLIIGNYETLYRFNKSDVFNFYNKHYCPSNCVISIVSSLDFEKVYDIVNEYFSNWRPYNSKNLNNKLSLYEKNKPGMYVKLRKDIQTSKIQYIFIIDDLNSDEIKALRIFNAYFGEGTSSVLYDTIRTKKGYAYDITSSIKNEKGIKLFTIYAGVDKGKVHDTINLINNEIENAKRLKNVFTKDCINKLAKRIKLKRELQLEQSIRLSMNLAVYGIMYNSPSVLYEDMNNLENITEQDILKVVNKVLVKPSIQVIESYNK